MSRSFYHCNLLLRNLSLSLDCQTTSTLCCIGQCCFVNSSQRKQLWENWYFWFIIVLICLLVVTSFVSYIAGSCKRKRHHLIRIHNNSASTLTATPQCGTISGPGGIIQPRLSYNKKAAESSATAFISTPGDLLLEDIAGPLSPPYPPVQQVTIVRGSAPPLGFRQTTNYTELVLPPGYIDTNYFNKR